jgi:hypothetical protein
VINLTESKLKTMSKKGTVTGKWVDGKHKIECNLPLIIFVQDNNVITYCPALDLSGYGPTEAEANKSFEVTLSEYFRFTVNKKTLAKDLRKLGWTLGKSFKKEPVPPTLASLLNKNKYFSRIFNTYDFHKRNTTVNMPTFI